MTKRYVYIVKGTEIPIVGVWSSRKEAIEEAINHAKDSGVIDYRLDDINDEFALIVPLKYEVFEKVEILRYAIQ